MGIGTTPKTPSRLVSPICNRPGSFDLVLPKQRRRDQVSAVVTSMILAATLVQQLADSTAFS